MEKELMGSSKITIETSCLIDNELTADLYLVLHHKHYNDYVLPKPIFDNLMFDEHALNYLQEREFIKITGDKEFELRQRAVDLFEVKTVETKWLEFLGKFPLKVPAQNGGTRPLKVSNPDSKANIKLMDKYVSIIKNKPGLHEQIVSVLEAEMKMRKNSNSMQYMNAIEAWLNQCNYEKYAYLLEDSKKENYENEDYM